MAAMAAHGKTITVAALAAVQAAILAMADRVAQEIATLVVLAALVAAAQAALVIPDVLAVVAALVCWAQAPTAFSLPAAALAAEMVKLLVLPDQQDHLVANTVVAVAQ
jgi:hypothetical protein